MARAPATIVVVVAVPVVTPKARYPSQPLITPLLLAAAVVAVAAAAPSVLTPSLVLSLETAVALVLAEPEAPWTAARVVLVVVVVKVEPVVPPRKEMPVALLSMGRASVVAVAAARGLRVQTVPVAAPLPETALVEVPVVTAHRLRSLGLPLHEQAAVVVAASEPATPAPLLEQVAAVLVGITVRVVPLVLQTSAAAAVVVVAPSRDSRVGPVLSLLGISHPLAASVVVP